MCNDRGRSNNGIWQLNNTKMVRISIKAKSGGSPSQFKGDRKGARSLRVNVYNNNILNQKKIVVSTKYQNIKSIKIAPRE
jgi:hypothetical protein